MSCTSHHFGPDGRCKNCGIKSSYLWDAVSTLNNWPESAKQDPKEGWVDKYNSYVKCRPHDHGVSAAGGEAKQK